ncbi:MAG: hypothetical protein Q8M76_15965, partial [Spirochaetaceae bacterium]|nr:hypothetical protein [Spirochaetaceae bacterium]
VFFSRDFDVESALSFIRARNGSGEGCRYSLFGLMIAAAVRTLEAKPVLNRFVHRRALYQRESVAVSFIVKKSMSEAAPETSAKVEFPPGGALAAMSARIEQAIDAARGADRGIEERMIDLLHKIPAGKAVVTRIFKLLDAFNIAPAGMIRNDPLFTSVYFANLGSLGLDTPFHHLYEWGTASLFVVMGRIFEKETRKADGSLQRRRFVNLKFTVDERIAEGICFARALSVFQRLIARPEAIDEPGTGTEKD